MFIFFNKLQILLNKMEVYFLLVLDSMSINAKFPVMLYWLNIWIKKIIYIYGFFFFYKIHELNKGNAKRGISPRLKIWPGDLENQ